MKNRLAQNKIDYIVYNNPKNAAALLGTFHYRSFKNPRLLARAVRELVKVEGRPAVEALVKIHPDRVAILQSVDKVQKCKFCQQDIKDDEQTCSNCAENRQPEFDYFTSEKPVGEKDTEQLKTDLDIMMKTYSHNPANKRLALAIQNTWNELRGRKDHLISKEQKKSMLGNQQLLVTWVDALIFLGFALFAGYMMYQKPTVK